MFLAASYGIGAPWTALLEVRGAIFSERFDVPPPLIELTCVVQVVAAVGLFSRRFAPWAAAALTVITLGAIAAHFRIGSPATALPALVYTAVQVWLGLESRALRP